MTGCRHVECGNSYPCLFYVISRFSSVPFHKILGAEINGLAVASLHMLQLHQMQQQVLFLSFLFFLFLNWIITHFPNTGVPG